MNVRSRRLALWIGGVAVFVAALSAAAMGQSPGAGTSAAADPAPRRAHT